jgi:hypothetical protein
VAHLKAGPFTVVDERYGWCPTPGGVFHNSAVVWWRPAAWCRSCRRAGQRGGVYAGMS